MQPSCLWPRSVCVFVSLHACMCAHSWENVHAHTKNHLQCGALCLQMNLPTTSSQYFYSEDSGHPECETVLLGEWFLTFKGITLLWKNGKHSPNTGSHARWLESLPIPLRLPHLTLIFFQMLHPTASIFTNDVKVHMLYTCGRILLGTDY
jgi:hypothetical protein